MFLFSDVLLQQSDDQPDDEIGKDRKKYTQTSSFNDVDSCLSPLCFTFAYIAHEFETSI